MTKSIAIGDFSYLFPTFALGFVWHLVAFKSYYDALSIYRNDVIIPFGFPLHVAPGGAVRLGLRVGLRGLARR